LPAFEWAFQAHIAEWRIDRNPRTTPRYINYPLPTPEYRLLFVLVYLKDEALHKAGNRFFEATFVWHMCD